MVDHTRHRSPSADSQGGLFALLLNDEPTRRMAALALSLALVLGATHLPLHGLPDAVGWRFSENPEPFRLDIIETREPVQAQEATATAPVTRHALLAEAQQPEEESLPDDEEPLPEIKTDAALTTMPQRVRPRQTVLEFTEQMPEIVGGLGSYYLNIEYPPQALAAGIQGRLLLEFIVETDGSVSRIDVTQSLHPLCDSAAVAALRRSRFVPGRQEGEPVRVRMRLPVRFVLRNQPSDALAADTTATL